jgi:hypothetical protein
LFSTKLYGGWDPWLRDTGRRLRESPESRVIADIARESKRQNRLTTKDTKEHKGDCQNRRNCQNRVIAKIEKQNLAPEESPETRDRAGSGKAKPLTTKDTKEHKGSRE